MYVKLCNFGSYAGEKALSAAKQQQGSPNSADVYKKLVWYRRLSFLLLLLCVGLLAVLLALAVKLSEAKSGQQCPALVDDVTEVEVTTAAAVCSRQACENLFPQPIHRESAGQSCSECGKGWLKLDGSCYLLSQERFSWQESREKCQKLGGDLVVISSDRVQRFLSEKGRMMYWIGLRRSETQQWTWVNNTTLTKGYWSGNSQDGDCVFLNGGRMHRTNWLSNPCTMYSQYICQKGLN